MEEDRQSDRLVEREDGYNLENHLNIDYKNKYELD